MSAQTGNGAGAPLSLQQQVRRRLMRGSASGSNNQLPDEPVETSPVVHSPSVQSPLRKRGNGNRLKMVATTVVAHNKFKKRKNNTGIDLARTELSFQRPLVRKKSSILSITRKVKIRMPKFGEVQFPSGLMTRFSVIGPGADPEKVFTYIIRSQDVWDLEEPKLILSIMGGAGFFNIDPAVEAHFCEGLVGAAKQTGGWVITGGTDSGVMDLVGKAMHKHDSRRTVPCIGIAPFGAMKEKWRSAFESVEEDYSLDTADSRDLQIVEAPQLSMEDKTGEEGKLAGLQQHHTHCVLVDSGKRGLEAFGTEVDLRENIEQFVANGVLSGTVSPKTSVNAAKVQDRADILRVMILVNGGPVSFKAIDQALKHSCPVVVCEGSGRAADFVAALKRGKERDFQEAWNKHMTAEADKKQGLQGVAGGEEALRRIVNSSCLTVYTIQDRLEDVILCSVMEDINSQDLPSEKLGEQLKRCLELAVQWRCTKHYARIGRKLVASCGQQHTIQWILGHFAKDWGEADGGPLMKWLLETQYEGVKKVPLTELHPPGLHWNGLQLNLRAEEQSSSAHLFLWLVENRAPISVVDAVWLQLEHPAHGALAAANCYRQLAERLRSRGGRYGDALASQRLLMWAQRYEDMAIGLLKRFDEPLEYLFRRSQRFGNHHLISLAHHLECKEFVAQQFYNSAVDILWVTPTPFAVFAFDKDKERRRQNVVTMSYWDLITGAYIWRKERIYLRDFCSVPRIKAFTHGVSRVMFIITYSYYVLFAEHLMEMLLSLLLGVWGVSLSLIEVLQLQAKSSFREYINMWNVLDIILLTSLLGSLIASWLSFFVAGNPRPVLVQTVHALNLLPCYVRLLQIFELSEYFGTLLFTVFGMAGDTRNFLVLLAIITLGFSCSLTPILFTTASARWEKGVSWGFWAIFGNVDIESAELQGLDWTSKFLIGFLQYGLSLTSNVLLVNLLIAMLNDTYINHKDASKKDWAFNRVDAVLEFSSPEAHILPPPLDLFVSLHALYGSKVQPISRRDQHRYCTVTKVRPLGPHEVVIHIEVTDLASEDDDVRDAQEAAESFLSWKAGTRTEKLTADNFTPMGPEPDDEDPKSPITHKLVGRLQFSNVPLTEPLEFTFGTEELGYQAVRISLDEDTWTTRSTRVERRQILKMQEEILAEVEAGEEKLEEKNEAKMAEVNQNLALCTEEIRSLSQQVAKLMAERGEAAKSEAARKALAEENEKLRAEVQRLREGSPEAPEAPLPEGGSAPAADGAVDSQPQDKG